MENRSSMFQIIVTIAVSMGAIIGLVLKFQELISLIRRVLHWIFVRWSMFKRWRYWRKHSPIVSIVNIESLYINERNETATLKVIVNWRIREGEIFPIEIAEGDIMADVGKNIPLLAHRPRPNVWQLAIEDLATKSYVLEATLGRKIKLIGSKVKCRFILPNIGLEQGVFEMMSLRPSYRVKVVRTGK
jgi:hypothetical protein